MTPYRKEVAQTEERSGINWKVQIATALVTAITTLIVAYWQFHTHPDSPTTSGVTLKGYVYGNGASRLDRARVSITSGNESRQLLTDSDGYFQFSGWTPANGMVSVTADKYKPQTHTLSSESYKDVLQFTLPLAEDSPSNPAPNGSMNAQNATPPPIESPGPKPFRARAEANIGWSYEIGEAGPPDYSAAMIWYQKSVKDGDAIGNWNIGRLYEHGFGVPKDLDKAKEWYQKAIEKGYQPAQDTLNNIGKNSAY